MNEVVIYTKPGCPYCAAAKKFYTEKGMTFSEFNVKELPEYAEQALKLAGGQRIVPVIVENGQVKLGFGGG